MEDKDNDLMTKKKQKRLKLKSTTHKMKQLSQNKSFLKSIFPSNVEKQTIRKRNRNNKRNTIRK